MVHVSSSHIHSVILNNFKKMAARKCSSGGAAKQRGCAKVVTKLYVNCVARSSTRIFVLYQFGMSKKSTTN